MIKIEPLWWAWKADLPDSLCDAIIEEGLLIEPLQGVVGIGDGVVATDKRDATVRWFGQNWIQFMVMQYAHQANSQTWGFHLNGCSDIQFTEYSTKQHYDFHMDTDQWQHDMRKVSIVIQLSDPEDYEGGDFEFRHAGSKEIEKVDILRKRGTVLVFPSWYEHRVTPVTKGTRYTLVAWMSGPALL